MNVLKYYLKQNIIICSATGAASHVHRHGGRPLRRHQVRAALSPDGAQPGRLRQHEHRHHRGRRRQHPRGTVVTDINVKYINGANN